MGLTLTNRLSRILQGADYPSYYQHLGQIAAAGQLAAAQQQQQESGGGGGSYHEVEDYSRFIQYHQHQLACGFM